PARNRGGAPLESRTVWLRVARSYTRTSAVRGWPPFVVGWVQATRPARRTNPGWPMASGVGVATVNWSPVSRLRASSVQASGFAADVTRNQASHGGSAASDATPPDVTT